MVPALRYGHLQYGDVESRAIRKPSTSACTCAFLWLDRPGEYLLVWTTTPWTLAANVAAAVHPDLPYVKVEQDGEFYYLAEELLPVLKALKGRDKGDYHVVETLKGSDMVGWRYRGPFDELPAEQGVVHTRHPLERRQRQRGYRHRAYRSRLWP